jgi:hypothetical protein
LEVESGSHGCEKLETGHGGVLPVEIAAFVEVSKRSALSQANGYEVLFGGHRVECNHDVVGNEAYRRCDHAP